MSAVAHVREPTATEMRWILEQLEQPHLFLGYTSRDIRISRLREVLEQRELVDQRAGVRNGEPETWRALLERLYGEPIFTTRPTTGET